MSETKNYKNWIVKAKWLARYSLLYLSFICIPGINIIYITGVASLHFYKYIKYALGHRSMNGLSVDFYSFFKIKTT